MEPYPPTLDVRFSKERILEQVKDKYQLNAYLLGRIFSVTRDANSVSDSDSETSSEENLSIFDSSEEEDEEEQEGSPKSSSGRTDRSGRRFAQPMPRYSDSRDGIELHLTNIAQTPSNKLASKMSITRSASARNLESVEQEFEENERKEMELEMEKRKKQKRDRLDKAEEGLDLDMIEGNEELKEVYEYYQVGIDHWEVFVY